MEAMANKEYLYKLEYISKIINDCQEANLQVILSELPKQDRYKLIKSLFEIDLDLLGEVIDTFSRLNNAEQNHTINQILGSDILQERVSRLHIFLCAYSTKNFEAGAKDPDEFKRRDNIARQMYKKFSQQTLTGFNQGEIDKVKTRFDKVEADEVEKRFSKAIEISTHPPLSQKTMPYSIEPLKSSFPKNLLNDDDLLEISGNLPQEDSRRTRTSHQDQQEDEISIQINEIDKTIDKIQAALLSAEYEILGQTLDAIANNAIDPTPKSQHLQKELLREHYRAVTPATETIVKEIKKVRSELPKKSRS